MTKPYNGITFVLGWELAVGQSKPKPKPIQVQPKPKVNCTYYVEQCQYKYFPSSVRKTNEEI